MMKTTQDQVNSQNAERSEENSSHGIHFEDSTQIYGDVINDSIIIQISKPSFWGKALQEWNESIFHWLEAVADTRTSWPSMVLHAFSALERIQPKIIFQSLATISLWILTIWLVAPILVWPQSDKDALLRNAISYSIASLMIPLLVSLFTVPEQIETRHITTHKQYWELQLLKFTAATVGFWTLSAIIIICALIAYYIGIPISSRIIQNGLVLLPLLFSYIVARTMPADRLKMFNGEFKLHSADRFFCIVFLFMGPALALALYGMAASLNDRFFGSSIFFIVGLITSFWAYKNRASDELPDPIAIFFLGGVLPISVVVMALIYPNPATLSHQEWLYLGMVIIYVLSETILVTTLLIRKQIKLAGRGASSVLLFCLLINIILLINAWLYRTSLWPTVAIVATLIIIWQFWGQKRFEHHARIHPSFWVMQASLSTSIYLLVQEWMILWLNAFLTLSVAAVVVRWAYQRPISDISVELPFTEVK